MFDHINNLEHVYMYTGKKIVKVKVIKFAKIDINTIFVKAENIGNLIFEKSFKVKKGEQVFSLNNYNFQNEKEFCLKLEISKIREDIQTLEENVRKADAVLFEYNVKKTWYNNKINILLQELKEKKELLNDYLQR